MTEMLVMFRLNFYIFKDSCICFVSDIDFGNVGNAGNGFSSWSFAALHE